MWHYICMLLGIKPGLYVYRCFTSARAKLETDLFSPIKPTVSCVTHQVLKLFCRMTEAVTHYGESIKAIMNEELGDGIMSAIDMYATVGRSQLLSFCQALTQCAPQAASIATPEPRTKLCQVLDLLSTFRAPLSCTCLHHLLLQVDVIKGKTGENRLVITLNGKVRFSIC